MNNISYCFPIKQQGIALVVSLMLLILMSLLGLGAMQSALLSEKMVSNVRFGNEALYAAEAGLRQAIVQYREDAVQTNFTGTLGNSHYQVVVTNSGDGNYTVTSLGEHAASGSSKQLEMKLSGTLGAEPIVSGWNEAHPEA